MRAGSCWRCVLGIYLFVYAFRMFVCGLCVCAMCVCVCELKCLCVHVYVLCVLSAVRVRCARVLVNLC